MNRASVRCGAAMRQGRICGLPLGHKLQHSSTMSLAKGAKRASDCTWKWKLMNLFGLTPDDYDRMLAAQGGVCAICGLPERARHPERPGAVTRLAVDHDHETGAVRGLLCRGCNTALAWFERVGDESVRTYLGVTV